MDADRGTISPVAKALFKEDFLSRPRYQNGSLKLMPQIRTCRLGLPLARNRYNRPAAVAEESNRNGQAVPYEGARRIGHRITEDDGEQAGLSEVGRTHNLLGTRRALSLEGASEREPRTLDELQSWRVVTMYAADSD